MSGPLWRTPGGRRAAAKRLAALLPSHAVYVEPFAGAASVLFAKQAAGKEVIGDIDAESMDILRIVQALTDENLGALADKDWMGKRALFNTLRDSKPRGRVDKLHRFLYVSRFSGGRKRKTFNVSDAGKDMGGVVKRLHAARDRLANVEIVTADYKETVAKNDGKKTVFFIDPPADGIDDELVGVLEGIEGKFVMVAGRPRPDWGRFSTFKVQGRKHVDIDGDGAITVVTNFRARKMLGAGVALDLRKAFPGGEPEAGLHIHRLIRENKITANDGAHRHAFMIDGSMVWTDEDGEHMHQIDDWGLGEGLHAHRIVLVGRGNDGSGLVAYTDPSSYHDHSAQSSFTGFDGSHQHRLQAGGLIVDSMNGRQIWEAAGKPDQRDLSPAPPASALAAVAMRAAGPRIDGEFVAGGVWAGMDGDVYVAAHEPAAAVAGMLVARMDAASAAAMRVVAGSPPMAAARIGDIVIRASEPGVIEDVVGDDAVGIVPAVLSWESVERGDMPGDGSGLPAAIEAQVPGHLRYWEMDAAAGVAARDALVDAGFADAIGFPPDAGEIRAVHRVERSAVAADLRDMPAEPATLPEIIVEIFGKAAAWQEDDPPDGEVEHDGVVFVPPVIGSEWAASGRLCDALDALEKHCRGAVVAAEDSVAARAAMSKHGGAHRMRRPASAGLALAFVGDAEPRAMYVERLADVPVVAAGGDTFELGKGADGKVYLTTCGASYVLNRSLVDGDALAVATVAPAMAEVIDAGVAKKRGDGCIPSLDLQGDVVRGRYFIRPEGGMLRVTSAPPPARVVKKAETEEERYILMVAMEPDAVDTQGEYTNAADIRKAAHDYMIRSRRIKLMHGRYSGDIDLVESWIAPVDMEIEGEKVAEGTWLVGFKIRRTANGDDIWSKVLAGELDGASIGGYAQKVPAETA